jgi:predicted DNA-binding transcriptional regulator YafY
MQISRLFEIVYILMNKKVTTAKELSEHFEVSQRTIYRDIDTLCQAGIPIYTTKGKGGGIGLMDNFVLNKSVLSEKEQKDILSALQGFKATSYDDTDQVLSKLNSLFGSQNTDWIEVDFSYWNSSKEDKHKFKVLKEAILGHYVIEFDYFNTKGEESHRTVEPIKLVFKVQAWYLYCYCRERKDMRYFKISRMNSLTMNSEVFIPTIVEKSEEEEVSYASNSSIMELVMNIDSEMAFRVFDELSQEQIARNNDGSFTIHAKFHSGSWLISYMMSYGDHIEILEPLWLHEQMIETYKNALKKNKYDI